MLSFYPGPSKLYPQVRGYMADAFDSGLLSANHRSPEFVEISRKAITLLKQKLNIPESYTVMFTSSATECWEIIAQSLAGNGSYHVFNGAFGEKWFEYTAKLAADCHAMKFGTNELLPIETLNAVNAVTGTYLPLICLTQNETSNATQVDNRTIAALRQRYRYSLIAVDATSSMAGIELDWQQADVWYASVQKCFGLPAGMAIMVCSAAAIEQALQLNENKHYNSLVFLHEKIQLWQTTYTPNVLAVYLLMRVMEQVPSIAEVSRRIKQQAQEWYAFMEAAGLNLLINNAQVRSDTVIAVSGLETGIKALKASAREHGIVLGSGYGKWKDTTFRIANFPAIEPGEINRLKRFLSPQ